MVADLRRVSILSLIQNWAAQDSNGSPAAKHIQVATVTSKPYT
jgi:hypothetical protein